jgi:hypothetical protein
VLGVWQCGWYVTKFRLIRRLVLLNHHREVPSPHQPRRPPTYQPPTCHSRRRRPHHHHQPPCSHTTPPPRSLPCRSAQAPTLKVGLQGNADATESGAAAGGDAAAPDDPEAEVDIKVRRHTTILTPTHPHTHTNPTFASLHVIAHTQYCLEVSSYGQCLRAVVGNAPQQAARIGTEP